MVASDLTLTKKHYARLRQYWQAGRTGLSSFGDGIALDLTAAGYLEMAPTGARLALMITGAGIEELKAENRREIERRRPHHDMAGRLSQWLRERGRATWENIELMVPRPEGGRKAVRPDVFSLLSSYEERRINPCVYEIKVNRADFLADVARPEKRSAYAQLAEQVYYVAPLGLVESSEVPAECGFVEEDGSGRFVVRISPRKRKVSLTVHQFMNLILKPGAMPVLAPGDLCCSDAQPCASTPSMEVGELD